MSINADAESTDNMDVNARSEPAPVPAKQTTETTSAAQEALDKPIEAGGVADPVAAPRQTKDKKDLRASPRYMVRWRIALVFDDAEGKPTFHGWTYDLSMNGTAMLTDSNVFSAAPVTILLAPPPLKKGDRKKVIEIQARQVYAVYSGAVSCFRLGLNFTKFKADGQQILKEMLTQYRPSEYRGDTQLK